MQLSPLGDLDAHAEITHAPYNHQMHTSTTSPDEPLDSFFVREVFLVCRHVFSEGFFEPICNPSLGSCPFSFAPRRCAERALFC